MTAAGGAIEIGDPADPACGTRVEVPEGALTADTLITLRNDDNPPAFPSEVAPAGPVVSLTPDGVAFNSPVYISLRFDPAMVSDTDLLVPLVFDDASGVWTVLTNLFTVDMASATMRIMSTHFSRMSVGYMNELSRMETYTTGFDPSKNGFGIASDQTCAGMVCFADWYYRKTKHWACNLFDVAPDVQRSIAIQAQAICS